jgi:hypothetical protein
LSGELNALVPATAFLAPVGSALCAGADIQHDDGDETDSLEPMEDDSYYPSGARLADPLRSHQHAALSAAAAA